MTVANLKMHLSSRLNSFGYLVLAGLASSIAALKGYLYSHLLPALEYAQVNYYLLVLGLGILFVGSGVMTRGQVALPVLLDAPARRAELARFISDSRGMGVQFWGGLAVAGAAALALAPAGGIAPAIAALSLVQILLFFFFTLDLVVIKSGRNFYAYAKGMLLRNACITAGGCAAALLRPEAQWAVAAEVAVCLLLCLPAFGRWTRELTFPARPFFVAGMKYVPVDILGAALQYADRLAAALLLTATDFSRYAYLSLVVMAGLSVQQLVNVRLITLLSVACRDDPRAAFRYASKVSAAVAGGGLAGLTAMYLLLRSPYFSAKWMGAHEPLEWLIVVVSLLRAVDFFSAYILAMGRKRLLIGIQLASLAVFAAAGLGYHFLAAPGLPAFLALMAGSFGLVFLAVAAGSWKLSRG